MGECPKSSALSCLLLSRESEFSSKEFFPYVKSVQKNLEIL
jgi:hypothetical protein